MVTACVLCLITTFVALIGTIAVYFSIKYTNNLCKGRIKDEFDIVAERITTTAFKILVGITYATIILTIIVATITLMVI